MTEFRKALSVVAGAVLILAASAWSDGEVTDGEWVQLATEAFAVLTVWITANGPTGQAWHYAKTISAAALTGLGLYAGYLAQGSEITDAMWLNLGIAVAAALGVLTLPNTPAVERPRPS